MSNLLLHKLFDSWSVLYTITIQYLAIRPIIGMKISSDININVTTSTHKVPKVEGRQATELIKFSLTHAMNR